MAFRKCHVTLPLQRIFMNFPMSTYFLHEFPIKKHHPSVFSRLPKVPSVPSTTDHWPSTPWQLSWSFASQPFPPAPHTFASSAEVGLGRCFFFLRRNRPWINHNIMWVTQKKAMTGNGQTYTTMDIYGEIGNGLWHCLTHITGNIQIAIVSTTLFR